MCGNSAPSPHSHLYSSLKRHASFVFLHGHDGMRLGGVLWWGNVAQQTQAEAGFLAPGQKQFTKRKGGGRTFFFFLVCKFEHRVRLCCPRFWDLRLSLKEWQCIKVDKGWLQTYVPLFGLLFKTSALIINIRALADLCDTPCFINKTSNTGIRPYYSTISGWENECLPWNGNLVFEYVIDNKVNTLQPFPSQ